MEAGNCQFVELDLVALSVNNRAISLIDAYVTLVKKENYLAAVPLIRLQLDNALRFYASTLVEDTTKFAKHFLEGNPIRNYKDSYGKKLTDSYIVSRLGNCFHEIRELYSETCDFIHLSESHFLSTLVDKKPKHSKLRIEIGGSGNFNIENKIHFSKNMLKVSKISLTLTKQWACSKDRAFS